MNDGRISFNPNYMPASEFLKDLDQIIVYEHYIGGEVLPNKLIKCLFHEDRSPSMGLYKTKSGNIRYNCFGCGAQGNVVEFVMNLFDMKFDEAVRKIQDDIGNFNTLKNINKVNNVREFPLARSKVDIIPIIKKFSIEDSEYWSKYGLDLIDVYNADIRSCSEVYYRKDGVTKMLCYYSKGNPIYSIKLSKGIYKIYRPLNNNKSGKWFSNSNSEDLQGINLVDNTDKSILIITSSMKDVLVLRKLGYNSVAPNGEGIRLPDKLIDYLCSISDNIIYFNDADEAGYRYTKKLSKETGFGYIFIPEEYGAKDISDFVAKYSLEDADILIKTLLKEKGLDGGRI